MIHPADKNARNPRIQCVVCAKWMRMTGKDEDGNRVQRFYGGCAWCNGDHLAAVHSGKEIAAWDVCQNCCDTKCKELAGGIYKIS